MRVDDWNREWMMDGQVLLRFLPWQRGICGHLFFLLHLFGDEMCKSLYWGLMFWREDDPRVSGRGCSRWFFGSDIWVSGLEIYLVWWFDVCYGFLGLL